jgi:hypothetical protein
MTCFICRTCGSQFADTPVHPADCPVCLDERQFVGLDGQQWTTLEELRAGHSLRWEAEGEFTGIGIEPRFAIGQRALLVDAPDGNVLWDCVSLLTEEAVQKITAKGGLTAIAISHPHYYSSMAEWSEALGGIPIYLHADDRPWVMRPHSSIRYWQGETLALSPSLTLIRCGGHFAGATVLHLKRSGRPGVLLAGDVLQVVADRKHLSFMYSYPNYIPLNAVQVNRIAAAVAPFDFDSIYGAWWRFVIPSGAKEAVTRSVERYLRAIA